MKVSIVIPIGIGIVLFGLLVIFVYQAMIKKRNIIEMILAMIFGICGSFFEVMSSITAYSDVFLAAELTCYGCAYLLLYIFLENMISYPINTYKLLAPYSFFLLYVISDWYIVLFINYHEVAQTLWIFADVGYDLLALTTFLVQGTYVYTLSYKYEKNKKTLLLTASNIIIGIGICIDIYTYFFGDMVSGIPMGEVFALWGLILMIATYASNVDFIYKFPFDNFILMVSYNYGVMICSTKFKSKKTVELEATLVSGLLSTINTVFTSILQIKDAIQGIHGERAHILTASGKYTTAIIISERTSVYQVRALRGLVREFEREFQKELRADVNDMSKFVTAGVLIKRAFPYLTPVAGKEV